MDNHDPDHPATSQLSSQNTCVATQECNRIEAQPVALIKYNF